MEPIMNNWKDELRAPEPDELKELVNEFIDRVMMGGKAKHGEHIWFTKETIRHHIDRVTRHSVTAAMRWEGDESPAVDGEDGIDHMERAVIRGLFALAKMRQAVYLGNLNG